MNKAKATECRPKTFYLKSLQMMAIFPRVNRGNLDNIKIFQRLLQK